MTWTPAQIRKLIQMTLDGKTLKSISAVVGHTPGACGQMRVKLGCGTMKNCPNGWFPKGHVPFNKGLRRPGWSSGRMRETQFKPGERRGVARQNWMPIGTITTVDGYLRIIVREARLGEAYGYGNSRAWPMLHRHKWEQAHGPIPPGYALIFRDRDRTNCELSNLELLTRSELMRRNSVHNLPEDLKEVIRLNATIRATITKRKKRDAEKHHG